MAKITIAEPLPSGVAPALVLRLLQSHDDLMDLGSLTKERHPIKPPAEAPPEEHHHTWQWYSITEKFRLPKDVGSGEFGSKVGFLDLPNGMISHVYSQLGVEVRDYWTISTRPPKSNKESSLWLKVDSEIKCKLILKSFVKWKVKQSRLGFVHRVIDKIQNPHQFGIESLGQTRSSPSTAETEGPAYFGVDLSSPYTNDSSISPGTPGSGMFELESPDAAVAELDSTRPVKELDSREIGPGSTQHRMFKPSPETEKHDLQKGAVAELDGVELRNLSACISPKNR
ncbi:hypothetical protein BKA67DRAFT_537045 [Truncatella angustata]|uniref:DUF7053 domain-containing protein n=1 Tax=Truncatella angustata TaxID=152316 RepID=A0A9P8UJQ4_9PEZI|nr:uncharacterized protein BKA67DRAFT_537045 [Truncatella angustata]KAH6653361.1 hypothetical protein BKA67DRAFT_537045 [Truncatella angustata]KAH8195833.1 hypothetical protein TruAng_010003 [Truncatella angustata]